MSNLDWGMYKAMLIGKIQGEIRQALITYSFEAMGNAMNRILGYIREYEEELQKRIKESEAKLNG